MKTITREQAHALLFVDSEQTCYHGWQGRDALTEQDARQHIDDAKTLSVCEGIERRIYTQHEALHATPASQADMARAALAALTGTWPPIACEHLYGVPEEPLLTVSVSANGWVIAVCGWFDPEERGRGEGLTEALDDLTRSLRKLADCP